MQTTVKTLQGRVTCLSNEVRDKTRHLKVVMDASEAVEVSVVSVVEAVGIQQGVAEALGRRLIRVVG
jgi:hypothetical protein